MDNCVKAGCPQADSIHIGSRKFFGVVRKGWVVFALLLIGQTSPSPAYSLLTHEEIIDIAWKDQIEPLLLKRFPGSTTAQLHRAQAFAYGGSLIQDIGYYPFGNKFFSELTHYVRTGDFVVNLIHDSADLDQYAFALGALAHYASDCSGHPLVNRAVAMAFPKLGRKYGPSVTYEDSPRAHIQTEFGFDMTQVAKHRYTSDQYHDFIGFEVSRPLLERAFFETYGLKLEEVLPHVDLAIGTFRRAVSEVIPEMTRAALSEYHPELVKEIPNFNEKKFLYNISRTQYEKEWGPDYQRPGFLTRMLGFLLRWIPKVGPAKALAFKIPTPQMEDLYMKSMNQTIDRFRTMLRQVDADTLKLPNMDCDTGKPTHLAEYSLGDETYARLLDELFIRDLKRIPPEVSADILAYFGNREPPLLTRKARENWPRTACELKGLQCGPDSREAREIHERLLHPPLDPALASSSKTFCLHTRTTAGAFK